VGVVREVVMTFDQSTVTDTGTGAVEGLAGGTLAGGIWARAGTINPPRRSMSAGAVRFRISTVFIGGEQERPRRHANSYKTGINLFSASAASRRTLFGRGH
jgi:hypothetical protein